MGLFVIAYGFEDNVDDALGSEILATFEAIQDILNGGIVQANCDTTAALLNATMHGNLSASTSTMHSTGSVHASVAIRSKTDLNDILVALDADLTTAEGDLTTAQADITTLQAQAVSAAKYIGKAYHATDETAAYVTVTAGDATNAVIIMTTSYLNTNAFNGDVECALYVNNEDLAAAVGTDEYKKKAYGTAATTVKGTWSKTFVVTDTELARLTPPTTLAGNDNTFRLGAWSGGTDGDFTVSVFVI